VSKHLAHDTAKVCRRVGFAGGFRVQDREGNFNKETFAVIAKSFQCQTRQRHLVRFKKDTGKKAAFFCYYISKGMSAGWKYFVPTDAHILGMASFGYYKLEVERAKLCRQFRAKRHLTQ
jgi:hypothetical protein